MFGPKKMKPTTEEEAVFAFYAPEDVSAVWQHYQWLGKQKTPLQELTERTWAEEDATDGLAKSPEDRV